MSILNISRYQDLVRPLTRWFESMLKNAKVRIPPDRLKSTLRLQDKNLEQIETRTLA